MEQQNGKRDRVEWFDALRGLSLLWIIYYHFTIDSIPIVTTAINSNYGPVEIAGRIFRIVGLTGGQGVSLFILLSGAGLTYSFSRHRLRVSEFYRRHFYRLLVPYGVATLALVVTLTILAAVRTFDSGATFSEEFSFGARLRNSDFPLTASQWLSFFLILPRMYTIPVTSAWFMVLILQLYLLFPLLWWTMRRFGRGWLLAGCIGVQSAAWILFLNHFNTQPWYPISFTFAIHQLVPFGVGMFFGTLLARVQPASWWPWMALGLVAWWTSVLAGGQLIIEMFLSLILLVIFVPLAGVLSKLRWLLWIGRYSLAVYLVHDLVRFAFSSWPIYGSVMSWWPWGYIFYLALNVILAHGLLKVLRSRFLSLRNVKAA